MKNKFRNIIPKRTCKVKYKNYRDYKKYLAKDFNHRCGYTDCVDFWFGGVDSFHIDHFKPSSKYPNLKNDYSNLVYCCPYVNILKSNDDECNYIDPCNTNFNEHFERNSNGKIIPKTCSPVAMYMYSKLKLYLARYHIIWMLEQIYNRMIILNTLISDSSNNKYYTDLKSIQADLGSAFVDYIQYLRLN